VQKTVTLRPTHAKGVAGETNMNPTFAKIADPAQTTASSAKQTNDFVHFVVHKAAFAGGRPCDMCAGSDALEYVPFIFTGLLTELHALR
jgi:hypothetical protein